MKSRKVVFSMLFLIVSCVSAQDISGELKKWHKVTLTFDGPMASEQGAPNPFTDFRLDVEFTHPSTGTKYVVPGYYAADGNAGQTSADAGNKWRAHFSPDQTGLWEYKAGFVKGDKVAVSNAPGESAGYFDGETGRFTIAASDKSGRDFRGKGRLNYVGNRYLQFADNGEYFLKQGPDSPENMLAYSDFDGKFKTDGINDHLIKRWSNHKKHWKPGDPIWQNGKGKGIIGAVNYLHSKGLNAFSFLTFNIEGDDRNVFMYTDYNEKYRIDVSRMDQWEILFEHAQKLGMFLHFKTAESENETWHDNGETGPERKFYYRELIARFSHHPALNWNLGEENGYWEGSKGFRKPKFQSTQQRIAMTQYFWKHDPYRHHIVIHNGHSFNDLITDDSKLTGVSLQTNLRDFSKVHEKVLHWLGESEKGGKIWAVACDEPGDPGYSLVPDKDDPMGVAHGNARKNALWGTFMAGGWGNEWYFGSIRPHSDIFCQDYSSRDYFWNYCKIALDFFRDHEIPYWEMKSYDSLTGNINDYVLAREGKIYLIYQKSGKEIVLDLSEGQFEFTMFNPRTGYTIPAGQTAAGPQIKRLSFPDAQDWVLIVRTNGGKILEQPSINAVKLSEAQIDEYEQVGLLFEEKNGFLEVEAEDYIAQRKTDKRKWYLTDRDNIPDIKPDGDEPHYKNASNGTYLEILPDTRVTHDDKLIVGENFSWRPGYMGIVDYMVRVNNPGRYYIWVRAYVCGSEDNGLHVGANDIWPESGARMQWCPGKNSWWWESRQRTKTRHCGEPHQIYLDLVEAGYYKISFSMREDGFEFDKWLMTKDVNMPRPVK